MTLTAAISILAEPLPVKHWTTADGLAHNQVIRIRRDSRGFLWFCTREGLSRFDGNSFTTFDTLDGLPHLTVTDLMEARDGSYWVATNGGGIAHFQLPDKCCAARSRRPGASAVDRPPTPDFKIYTISEIPAQNRVNTVFQDRAGRIYAGTDDGVYRSAGAAGRERFERLDPERSPDSLAVVTGLTQDTAGNLWIGSWKGLARLTPDGRFARFSVHPVQEFDYVTAVLTDRAGHLWVGVRGAGVIVINPEELILPDRRPLRLSDLKTGVRHWFNLHDGLPDLEIWSLHQSVDGVIWIGSEGHLTSYDGSAGDGSEANKSKAGKSQTGSFQTVGDQKKISKVGLTALAEDAAGNLWSGGELGALQVIRGGLTTWSGANGLSNDLPQSIAEGADGSIHVITSESRINRFNGEKFQAAPLPAPHQELYYESNLSAFQDRQGEWWIPVRRGIWRFPRAQTPAQLSRLKPYKVYDGQQGLPPEAVVRMFEDSRGDIWCSTAGKFSLVRWERGADRFRLFGEADGVPLSNPPLAYSEDRSGTIWMGMTGGGLLRYREGQFKLFTAKDGVPGGAIQSLYFDCRGQLWMGSDKDGAGCIEAPEEERPDFKRYTQREGLSSGNILSLAEDQSGIYFGTGRGLDRLALSTGRIRNWFGPPALNISGVSLLRRDRNGYLWAGGLGGLLRLSPNAKRPPPSPVFITGLTAGDASLRLPIGGADRIESLELAPGQNRMLIGFTSAWLYFGERPLFQYKLIGIDADWSAPTSQRSVNYAGLTPGDYQFLVRVIDEDGRPSEGTASVSFNVLPPLWRRWWFAGLVLLTAGGLGYAAVRYRVSQLLQLERMRTRIATDLHDDIGANLTRISILSEVANQQNGNGASPIGASLNSIAEIARESVASMSDIVWAINPERDSLIELTRKMRQHAEEVFTLGDVALKLTAPDATRDLKLDVNLRRDLYLIFKEAVNNVARHSGCSSADIELRVEGARLILTISDDGRGFDPAAETEGNGLLSIRSRAARLGGELLLESRKGAGSRLRLVIPLVHSWLGD